MIQTQHLLLRPVRAEDAELIYQLDSSPQVVEYLHAPLTREESAQHLQQILVYNKFYNNQLGFWIVEQKVQQQPIGWFALKHLDQTQEIEIGARILPDYWNRTYATEIALELLQYAWAQGLRRVVSVTHPLNIPPQQVLRKIGFQFQKKAYFYNQEVHFYAIAAPGR